MHFGTCGPGHKLRTAPKRGRDDLARFFNIRTKKLVCLKKTSKSSRPCFGNVLFQGGARTALAVELFLVLGRK